MKDGSARVEPCVRHRLEVTGIVQGVGFRPFVFRLAEELALTGWVRNDSAGVTIEVEGSDAVMASFARRLACDAPPLARVDAVTVSPPLPLETHSGFHIVDSGRGRNATGIPPDSAVCAQCLEELFEPTDRRYRYAFVNCTHCGPRYTITHALPYDRSMTSMRSFAQCPACLAEYRDPRDRRFHAEPNACPACGPRLSLVDAAGVPLASQDVAATTVTLLQIGLIVAIKGLGGFHLACDARNAAAVARLRARKAREEKPFAVMVANVASLAALAEVSAAEAAVLESRERPIVLARKAATCDAALAQVAPGLAWLGAMLPYTPLHYLLFHEAARRPAGTAWLREPQPLVLVMTSGNPRGEPLVMRNEEALMRIGGIADAFLIHDRDIVVRCDDSVVRVQPAAIPPTVQFVRRARGYTPRAIKLAAAGPAVLAVGGHLKNTICVLRGDEAFLSQHLGDLESAAARAEFEAAIDHLLAILEVEPAIVAHDLHPDFHSTRYAVDLAARRGIPTLGVQHHHAHVAAIAAEHGLTAPVLGLALDGFGLGTDGGAWGGELLYVEGATARRLSSLVPLRLPGGDRAAQEPWRMAAAALSRAAMGATLAQRFAGEPGAAIVATMLERGLHAPWTTSMGRWFDAAAGLLEVTRRSSFEGQAAMLLEGLADAHGPVPPAGDAIRYDATGALDLTALAVQLADIQDAGYGAALFHATLAEGLAGWVARFAADAQCPTVACGGGCFLNAVLVRDLRTALSARGIALLESVHAPPNDGGLALGQAWVARASSCANVASTDVGRLQCA